MPLAKASITFVGAGSMAEAIIRGLTSLEEGDPGRITMLNRSNIDRLKQLRDHYEVSYATDAHERQLAIQQADVLVIAFKPKDALEGLRTVAPLLSPSQLLISVIAGLSIASIHEILGNCEQPVVRTMPNTSSSIGLGATGIAFSSTVSEKQRKLAIDMFESTGLVTTVEENKLDLVTGVSGSGPAYVYAMMEAMISAAIQGGLDPLTAKQLTVQTVLGAASMVDQTGENPADLRRKVTSPNGTTEAALQVLASHQFAKGIERAVARAAERAGELGAAIHDQAVQLMTQTD